MDKLGAIIRLAGLAAAEQALKTAVVQAGGKLVLTAESRDKAQNVKVVGCPTDDDTYTLIADAPAEGERPIFYPEVVAMPDPDEPQEEAA
jgi:hypothetical protein